MFFVRNRFRLDSKAREVELMRAVLEFGRMKFQLYKTDITIIDATEIAFRFRETRRSVTRALTLLELQGLVERTDLPRLWKLNGAGLQQSGTFSGNSPEAVMSDSLSCVSEKQPQPEPASILAREDPCRAGT